MIDYLKITFRFVEADQARVLLCRQGCEGFGTVIVRHSQTDTLVSLYVKKVLQNQLDVLLSLLELKAAYHGKVQRLDICADYDLSPTFMFPILEQNAKLSGAFGSPARGRTLYFGSRRSLSCFRIYDKAKEIERKTRQRLNFNLLRYEVELHRGAADQALRWLAASDDYTDFEEHCTSILGRYASKFDILLPEQQSIGEGYVIERLAGTIKPDTRVMVTSKLDVIARELALSFLFDHQESSLYSDFEREFKRQCQLLAFGVERV